MNRPQLGEWRMISATVTKEHRDIDCETALKLQELTPCQESVYGVGVIEFESRLRPSHYTYYKRHEFVPFRAMFVGVRYLKPGVVWSEYAYFPEDDIENWQNNHFRQSPVIEAWLFVRNMRDNPVHVLPEDVSEADNAD